MVNEADLAAGSNRFGLGLWKAASGGGTFAISPASLSAAFAMLHGGARGETASELRSMFGFEDDPDATMTGWGAFVRRLGDGSMPGKLRMAQRLFGDASTPFEASYLDKVLTAFGASLEACDFRGDAGTSRSRINGWVASETEGRVLNLLPPGALTPLTRLVLVNAIYFLAGWEQPFDPHLTRPALFEGTTARDVPTMSQRHTFPVGRTDGAHVLELPYRGWGTSLFVLLPEKRGGLAELEAHLSPAMLGTWLRATDETLVDVFLPRFELAALGLSLRDTLVSMGVAEAFDPARANLGAMRATSAPTERLHVDDAFHKAVLKVDENGTEAAAATAVTISTRGMPPTAATFRADHPFLVIVVERSSGLVLFMGRVVDP